jgi:hypothetical protein
VEEVEREIVERLAERMSRSVKMSWLGLKA